VVKPPFHFFQVEVEVFPGDTMAREIMISSVSNMIGTSCSWARIETGIHRYDYTGMFKTKAKGLCS